MDVAKPYKFIWFGDIHGTKPYKFIGFGDIHGPKPYKFIGFGNTIGQNPALAEDAPPWAGPAGVMSQRAPEVNFRPSVVMSGSCANRYSVFSGFRPIFGQPWPPNLSRTTGLVLQCRLHQKSAPQTNSKTISCSEITPSNELLSKRTH